MRPKTTSTALWAVLSTLVSSHSWVEQMSVLDDGGAYTGTPGYPRGFVPRGDPKFNDDAMTVRLPVTGRTGPNDAANRIVDTDLVCATAQASPSSQNAQYPPLAAAPGNYVSLRYLENGHVSMPDAQPGKPGGGGLVYVYGTTNSKTNPKLLDVMGWKSDASLDQGRLLAVNTFDDGRCHQIRNTLPTDPPPPWRNNSPQRQKDFPNGGELACETNIQIPKEAKDSLTLYWVWQWPSLPGQKDASGKAIGIPAGKDEIYTTCMDVKIGAATKKRTLPKPGGMPASMPSAIPAAAGAPVAASPANAQSGAAGSSGNSSPGSTYKLVGIVNPLIKTAPANYKERAANVTLPMDTAFYGPNNIGGMPRSGAGNAGNAGGAAPANAQPAKPSQPVPASASIPKASGAPMAAGAQGGYSGSGSPAAAGAPKPAAPAVSPIAKQPPPASAAPPVPATVTVTVTVQAPAPSAAKAAGPAGCIGALPIPSALLSGFIGGAAGANGGPAASGSSGGARRHGRFFRGHSFSG